MTGRQRPGETRPAPAPGRPPRARAGRWRCSWGSSRRRRRAGTRRWRARAPGPRRVGDAVGGPSCSDDRHERVVQRRLRHRAQQHRATVMPSCAVASSEPDAVQRLQAATAARLLPASASGSSWLRRADIAANSAPTKKALAAEQHQRDDADRRRASRSRPLLPPSVAVVAPVVARRPAARLGSRHEAHPVDPVPVHVDDPCRPAVDRHGVADGRHPAQGRHHPAADRLVGRPVGDDGARPGRAPRRAATAPAPSTTRRAAARPVVCERSCSSVTSPTISSTTSSRVTTPECRRTRRRRRRAAGRPGAAGSSSGSSRIVSGTSTAGTISADTGTSARRSCGTAMAFLTCTMPSMSSQSSPDDGEAGVPGAPRQPRRRRPAVAVRSIEVARERGRHHVGGGLVAEAEGCRDQPGGAAVEGARLGRASAPARPAPPGCGPPRAPPAARCRARAGCGWRPR